MEKFTVLNGLVAPLDRANVDTDQIIPKQYLSSIKRTGFGQGLFAEWRKDPQFVLNQPRFKGAAILLARRNFGCGAFVRRYLLHQLLQERFSACRAHRGRGRWPVP